MPNAYIFFGLSGSGKGTQAKLIREYLEESGRKTLPIETGKHFRRVIDNSDTYTSSLIEDALENGKLLPEFLPIWGWTQILYDSFTGAEDLIFDGVSRRVAEAPVLDGALSFYGIEKRFIIILAVSHEVATNRLLERGRFDDTPEDIRSRLAWYEEDVTPVLDYFKAHDTYEVLTIDGAQSRDEVFNEIVEKTGIRKNA